MMNYRYPTPSFASNQSMREFDLLMRVYLDAAKPKPPSTTLRDLVEAEAQHQVTTGTVQMYVDRFVLKTDALLDENNRLRKERDEALTRLEQLERRQRRGDTSVPLHHLQIALSQIEENEHAFGRKGRERALDAAKLYFNQVEDAADIIIS